MPEGSTLDHSVPPATVSPGLQVPHIEVFECHVTGPVTGLPTTIDARQTRQPLALIVTNILDTKNLSAL